MSRSRHNDETCPSCGMSYRAFRTGFSFKDVRDMMHVSDDDSRLWVYRRRNAVLGKWFQLKRELWFQHRSECAAAELEPGSYELAAVCGHYTEDSYVPF